MSNIGGQFVFFVASNRDEACTGILISALEQLKSYLNTVDEDTKRRLREQFIDYCVSRAQARIRHCARELTRFINGCLLLNNSAASRELMDWLNSLSSVCASDHSPRDICRTMYGATRHALWRELERRADQIGHPFTAAKHTIGRLASRLRAPRDVLQLVDDHPAEFSHIINHSRVEAVPRPTALQCPLPDNQTYLDGLLSRLLGANHPRTKDVRTAILEWGRYSQREPRKYIMDRYKTCAPIVHAEISVLEWFHVNTLNFLGGDRYIFTSKPACYCCKLYFRFHPLRMREPESHNKIPRNWGPPVYNGIVEKTQLDILNAMKAAIRDEVLDETDRIVQRLPFHADSTTGVPASSAGGISGYSAPLTQPSPLTEPSELSNGNPEGARSHVSGDFGWVYPNDSKHERDGDERESTHEHEHDGDEDEGGAKL